jgi:hypothetical protein
MTPMTTQPPILATFTDIDAAESALDWIGVDFDEDEDGFAGELVADDEELLDEVLADGDAPGPVRALATALGDRLATAPGAATWRVTFGA